MPTYLVQLRRSGAEWQPRLPMEQQARWVEHSAFMDELVTVGFVVLGGPLADEHRVVLAVTAGSEEEVRTTLGRDPWSDTHLVVDSVEPWTIRLDGRHGRW